jgi:UDP-glucose 4-epimerase
MTYKILISGGAGYIGSVLCHHLNDADLKFAILDKKKINPKFLPKNTKIFSGCISSKKILGKICNDFLPTHIIHLAALTNVNESNKNKKKYFLNNITRSKKFFSFFKSKGIENFFFSSTAAVYSDTINKKHENNFEKPSNFYGKTKFLIENYLKNQSVNQKINIKVLRFFNVIGCDYKLRSGNTKKNCKSLFQNLSKKILFKKDINIFCLNKNKKKIIPSRDFIDVNDIAKILIFFIKKNKNYKFQVFNLGSGKKFNIFDIANKFVQITKSSVKVCLKSSNYAGALSIISNNKKIKSIFSPRFIKIEDSIKNHYLFYKKNYKYFE